MFGGMKVTVSTAATKEVIRWPVKKRSRRLHKKMTARLGQQIVREPCALTTPFGLIVHPEIYAALKREVRP